MNLEPERLPPCQEIVELINELIDGDADPERMARARNLIRTNQQCAALYQTLLQTINLYRVYAAKTLPSPDLALDQCEDEPPAFTP